MIYSHNMPVILFYMNISDCLIVLFCKIVYTFDKTEFLLLIVSFNNKETTGVCVLWMEIYCEWLEVFNFVLVVMVIL